MSERKGKRENHKNPHPLSELLIDNPLEGFPWWKLQDSNDSHHLKLNWQFRVNHLYFEIFPKGPSGQKLSVKKLEELPLNEDRDVVEREQYAEEEAVKTVAIKIIVEENRFLINLSAQL